MSNCIKAILMEELETCVEALVTLVTYQSDDMTMCRGKREDELETWTQRLARVKKALFEVENTLHMTQSERNTLRTLIKFHESSYATQEDAPFNLRDHVALLDKLRG